MSKFLRDSRQRKDRGLCKLCSAKLGKPTRTSLVKVNKPDGSKVVRCNRCRAEHPLKPRKRK